MDIEDEREEGELTDEDLEDVSDTSSVSFTSIASTTGKSTSSRNSRLTREPFRELSLTSISDESEIRETRHRGECRRRRFDHEERSAKRARIRTPERRVVITNHRPRMRTFTRELSNISSSSNNSDDYRRNRKLFKQLRDAVTINCSSQKLPNCSLRSRLNRMIEPKPDIQGSNQIIISDVDEDLELETLRDQALQSKLQFKKAPTPPSIAAIDPDLMQLRLQALKSTVLKRHHIRQRLKEGQQIEKDLREKNSSSPSVKQKSTESKENNVTDFVCEVQKISENGVENITEIIVEEQNIPSPFEGERVTNDKEIELTVDKQTNTEIKEDRKRVSETIDDDEDILRAMLLTSISKNIENKKSNSNNLNLPICRKGPENNNNNNIEKALKRHPMPVVKRLIINVNSDSDSDEFLPDSKKQSEKPAGPKSDMFDKNLALFLQQARAKTEAKHHSNISRLPRQQQLEYKKLKKKLNLLTSQLKPAPVAKVANNSSCPDENNQIIKQTAIKNKYVVSSSSNKITSNPPSDLNLLKLKATDGQRNNKQPVKEKEERLQMKGKYEELAPLMAKISEALKAREKAQSLVKKLINELHFARNELTTSHQTYTGLVQQLMKSKESIDKRSEDRIQKIKTTKKVSTSTPLKQTSKLIPLSNGGPIGDQALPVLPLITSTAEEESKNVSKRKEDDEARITAPAEVESARMEIVDDAKIIEIGKAEVIRPVDAVENISISNTSKKESGFLKYSSPLDHLQIHREQPVADPLQELCPYDLLGVCRDADCPYQHFGHAITE